MEARIVREWWALAATSRSVSYRGGARQAWARSAMNAELAAALPNWVYHDAQATVVACVLTPRREQGSEGE